MRHLIIAMFFAFCLAGAGAAPAVVHDAAVATVYAQPEVDIDIGNDPWYEQPVWIAIAIIGALVVVILVVMAVRGGGSKV